jgi:hypothetical protein
VAGAWSRSWSKERVELFLYCPVGLNGMDRATLNFKGKIHK